MNYRMILGSMAVGLVLTASVGMALEIPEPVAAPERAIAADAYAVDGVHSSLIFKINHMGVTNFYGRFNTIKGTYTLNGESSSFEIEVPVEGIDSVNENRDKHLRSPDFFNAAEFPTISFKSTKAEPAGENKLRVHGDLSLHGVTKPLVTEMTIFPPKETRQGLKSGFETTFTIKRSDFGMNYGVGQGALGDEVTITVAIEGAQRSS